MDMFARGLAPINGEAWKQIEEQAVTTLRANLSARRFVDVKGPHGWDHSCVYEGRLDEIKKEGGVGFAARKCIRLVETRVDFELDLMELHSIERGCDDPDLVPVETAAKAAAAFEDGVVYKGLDALGMKGLMGSAELEPLKLSSSDPEAFLLAINGAICDFKTAHSIDGPFALVGGKALRDVLCKIVSGRTWFDVVEKNSGVDEYIYTPSCEGAMLVSKRGGDFELTLGGDFTVGYSGRNGDKLGFFLAESLAFRVLEPRAFVPLIL